VIENTITAAQAAVDRGFSIECDVQLTADGEAVVFHDFDLNRLTAEQGKVGDRRLAELTAIAIAGSASDRIPSLQGFLDRVAGRQEQHRQVALAPQLAEQREPVGVGQHHVEQHQVGLEARRDRTSLGPGPGGRHLEADEAQAQPEHLGDRGLVVDDEDLRPGGGCWHLHAPQGALRR
jgi:hypothetical protein